MEGELIQSQEKTNKRERNKIEEDKIKPFKAREESAQAF
jgi:hypothetical protein